MENQKKLYRLPVKITVFTDMLTTATSAEEAYEKFQEMQDSEVKEKCDVKIVAPEGSLVDFISDLFDKIEERDPAEYFVEGIYESGDRLLEIYYNPNSNAGGQMVIDWLDMELISGAFQHMQKKLKEGRKLPEIADYFRGELYETATQYCIDIDEEHFASYLRNVPREFKLLFPNDDKDYIQLMLNLIDAKNAMEKKAA